MKTLMLPNSNHRAALGERDRLPGSTLFLLKILPCHRDSKTFHMPPTSASLTTVCSSHRAPGCWDWLEILHVMYRMCPDVQKREWCLLPYRYLLSVCMQYLKTLIIQITGGNVPKWIQLLGARRQLAPTELPLPVSGPVMWYDMKAVLHTDWAQEPGLVTKALSNLKNTVIFQTLNGL